MHKESLAKQEIGCDIDVKGYRILIKAPELPEKTKSGIILVDQYKNMERRSRNIGLVLSIGPTAFNERFEDRRCNIGDWVIYSIYEREELYPNDKLCYFINDERIYGIIPPHELPAFIKELR